ncbi:DUF262 domain-containing protein [Rhodomicrobium sp. Az07]|uniref:DUF262 domain-containing protein n=1 Tax=Rhodomicrobium sp. Az07 TaxID=2839034 RepID=UPI001BE7E08E|nr:DUF262 domain-containing protein [Rhodomicrobium sp. Az07]MBT3070751.1 DUF262 domain-containing protein [Rhodomicrobium sp. Az07]
MSEPLPIRKLIERVQSGTIRVPKFQRGFVWGPDRVAFLMDSIYRGYPIGSLLLWRSHEKLTSERDLGPFTLPVPEKDWPVDYVLDGQQRLTSLFGVFQTAIKPNSETNDFNICFNMAADKNSPDDLFVCNNGNYDIRSLFSLRLLFDTPEYAKATRNLDDESLCRIAELQRRFQEASIPATLIEFKDREQIAMIFERINRAGVPLDTFQLLTAWTWSNEFYLTEKIRNLGYEVDPYGYAAIGEQQDLLMKCCSAVVTGDASARSVLNLKGPTVRQEFEKIKRGILGAIEFLRNQLCVHSLEVMPYPAMLVPLTRFFATDGSSGFSPTSAQTAQLKRWFWKSCFSRRYSSGVGKAHSHDISAMDTLRRNGNAEVWKINASVTPNFFFENNFIVTSVNTKIFILLLVNQKPKSFISGCNINLDDVLLRCNRNEFHHIFPKGYLKKFGDQDNVNLLVNFCFLSAADNQKIKDKSPSEYVSMVSSDHRDGIFKQSCLPVGWHSLTYSEFRKERSILLAERAKQLMGDSSI